MYLGPRGGLEKRMERGWLRHRISRVSTRLVALGRVASLLFYIFFMKMNGNGEVSRPETAGSNPLETVWGRRVGFGHGAKAPVSMGAEGDRARLETTEVLATDSTRMATVAGRHGKVFAGVPLPWAWCFAPFLVLVPVARLSV
jgi:hypothetical protein